MTKDSLEQHLRSYGIRHFTSDAYWEWGGNELGPELGERLNDIREPLIEGATTKEQLRFYDFIARPDVSGVVHSMKADAIRASGNAADAALPSSGRILDLGCAIGHLTTFYALRSDQRQVVGCDFSSKTIERAKKEAKERNAGNVTFVLADISKELPRGKFDGIVSTQVIATMKNRRETLGKVAGALAPNGFLISTEVLGTADEAAAYVREAADCGLGLAAFAFIYYSDLGECGAYPVLSFTRDADGSCLDLEEEYQKVLSKLSGDG